MATIVLCVSKFRSQKEEMMATKKNPEIDRRWWGIYCLSTDRLVATHLGTKSVAQDIASENDYVAPLRSSGLPKRRKRKAGGGKPAGGASTWTPERALSLLRDLRSPDVSADDYRKRWGGVLVWESATAALESAAAEIERQKARADGLAADLAACVRERDAYRKAKQENDERIDKALDDCVDDEGCSYRVYDALALLWERMSKIQTAVQRAGVRL